MTSTHIRPSLRSKNIRRTKKSENPEGSDSRANAEIGSCAVVRDEHSIKDNDDQVLEYTRQKMIKRIQTHTSKFNQAPGIRTVRIAEPSSLETTEQCNEPSPAVSSVVSNKSNSSTLHSSKGILKHNLRYPKENLHTKLQKDTLDDELNSYQLPNMNEMNFTTSVKHIVKERINPVADEYPFDKIDGKDFSSKCTITKTETDPGTNGPMKGKDMAVNGIDTIETDMEFTCMTKQEYESTCALPSSSGDDVEEGDVRRNKNGVPNMFDCQNDEASENHEINGNRNQGEDDDCKEDEDLFNWFSDEYEEEEDVVQEDPKSFIVLWNCLSTWITPEAVALLREWKADLFSEREENLHVNVNINMRLNDVSASRCAGLMSMLKLHQSKAATELGYKGSGRALDTRLGSFIQCFDFSTPMVKLNGKLWKALCIILLKIILPKEECTQQDGYLPPSIQSIDLSLEEYVYLIASAISSLHHGSA